MRLLKRAEYEAVYGAGQRRSSPQFSIFFRARTAPPNESRTRVDLTTSDRAVSAARTHRPKNDATSFDRNAQGKPGTLDAAPVSRFGISVKKALGGAVVRNRIRRRIREILRRNRAYIPKGWDIVIHPRPSVARAPFAPLEAELVRLLSGIGTSEPKP